MKWTKKDLEQYTTAKEYIDTLLLPLLPFQFSDDALLAKNAFQMEILTILVNELEKELMGRVLLAPSYNYLKQTDKTDEIKRLSSWVEDAQKQSFEHIFYITFDASWKKDEQALNGTLLWLPIPQTGDMDAKEMRVMIRDQVEQVGEFIRSYW